MNSAKSLVVIPAFNEAQSVFGVVSAVRSQGFVVLVVDDGSSDATSQEAKKAGAHVVRLPINLGVGGALRCGFKWATEHGYDTVIQCDADGQHSPDEIPALVKFAFESDLHLTIGSRFIGKSDFTASWIRRIPMRLMAKMASHASGSKLTDTSSGFRVIRKPLLSEFARRFPVHYLGDTFDVTVEAGRQGYKIGEFGTNMHARENGLPSTNSFWSVLYLGRSLAVLMIGSKYKFTKFGNERTK